MTERGTVKEIQGRLATVQLEQTEGCDACHNEGCKVKRQAIQAWNRDDMALAEGDEVEVEVEGKAQLEGALWVLGLPLLLFVAGYFALRALTPGATELPAALGGLGGLCLGMVIGVSVQKRKKLESLPRISRVGLVEKGVEAEDEAVRAAAGNEVSFKDIEG